MAVPYRGISKMFLLPVILCLTVWTTGSTVANGVGFGIDPKKQYNSLDYVSLTDNSDISGKLNSDSMKDANTTWVIGKGSCSSLQPGCDCDARTDVITSKIKSPLIVCSCNVAHQVVNLRGYGEGHGGGDVPTRWRIQGCSKVIVQNSFLSALTGKDIFLEFKNISSMIIHESAFSLKELGSSSHNTTIIFSNTDIRNVPPKAFPSYLSTIKFVNCTIGTLSSSFIQALRMGEVIFENTNVDDVKSDAFYSNTILDSLIAKDSHFIRIHPGSLASAIQHLSWSDCKIDHISNHGITGLIASVVIERCIIKHIDMHGLSVKSWTVLSLQNNTFEKVRQLGIDLAHPEMQSIGTGSATLMGNTWKEIENDFIGTGLSDEPFVIVKNNTFLTICSCGVTFTSFLTLNGSRPWFHDELFNSSRCLIDEKEKLCLTSVNNNEGFVEYEDLPSLCSPEVFMCASQVQDVPVKPVFPNRLLIAAFLIGAFVLFMVVSLLLTMIVYMIRRKSPAKVDMQSNGTEAAHDMPPKEFMRSINTDQYSAMTHRIPKTPSMPTRLGTLEDVEMEDKGVQTMPTEFSADIIEGLREKLTKPDSFWDAKEAIDHLYDLIHVQEQSAVISSPPDVTVRNDHSDLPNSSNSSTRISHDSLRRLISSPSRKLPKIVTSDRPSRRSISSSAQIPSPTRSAQICDYRDPSDSKVHIYSELTPGQDGNCRGGHNERTQTQPILCDYNEPRDFQNHIYAELSHILNDPNTETLSPTKSSQTQTGLNTVLLACTDALNDLSVSSMQVPIPSSVIPSSPQDKPSTSSSVDDFNAELPSINFSTFPTRDANISSESSLLSSPNKNFPPGSTVTITNPSQPQRPLPAIPFLSVSTVQ